MFKPIFYKEWLKIKWTYLAMFLLTLLVLSYILLMVSKQLEFNEAKTFWGLIIFRKYKFFSDIQFIPLLSGLLIGIAQYVPEASQSRLKLTLHLPVNENVILMQMLFSGFMFLSFLFSVTVVILILITSAYFPKEIVYDTLLTFYPWMLAGFAAYFTTAGVMVEPSWTRRIILIITSLSFVMLLFTTGDFTFTLLLFFTIITMLIPLWTLFTGYNFKRGIV